MKVLIKFIATLFIIAYLIVSNDIYKITEL